MILQKDIVPETSVYMISFACMFLVTHTFHIKIVYKAIVRVGEPWLKFTILIMKYKEVSPELRACIH